MTTMKNTTTCGRREMRALYEKRQVNVAAPGTRKRVEYPREPSGKLVVIAPERKVRDIGTAEWNNVLRDSTRLLSRAERRALAAIQQKSTTKRSRAFERAMIRAAGARVSADAPASATDRRWDRIIVGDGHGYDANTGVTHSTGEDR